MNLETLLKTEGETRCCTRVSSSCFTSGTVTIKLFDSNILVLVSRLSLKTGTLFFPPSCRLQSSISLQQVKTNY